MEQRRYDLDWLRVFAIILLHFFHSAMPFVTECSWLIKNKELSSSLLEFNYFVSRWRMPLLFLISGVGASYLFNQYSTKKYIWQKVKRLLVPLIFGMLVVVPPQVYYKRLYEGIEFSNYAEFYPTFFSTGVYPSGNFSWLHLWFVANLLCYSVIAIPLFFFLKTENGKKVIEWIIRFSKSLGLYWFAIPIYMASLLGVAFTNQSNGLTGDWTLFVVFLLYFLIGYCIATSPSIWDEMEKNRRQYLRTAFLTTILINYFRWNHLEPNWSKNPANLAYLGILVLSAWAWMLAIFGYAKKYLNFKNKFLAYSNEGIYAFYILHQTLIIIIGYYVIQSNDSVATKYLFLTVVSFALTFGIYEFLIRPYNVMRFLFGMRRISCYS